MNSTDTLNHDLYYIETVRCIIYSKPEIKRKPATAITAREAWKEYVPDGNISSDLAAQLSQVVGFEWAFMGSTILGLAAFILALFLHPPKKEKEIVRQIHSEKFSQ